MLKDSKNVEADEVLNFINSLPEAKNNESGKKGETDKKEESGEDFMEFLDELAAHDQKHNVKDQSKGKDVKDKKKLLAKSDKKKEEKTKQTGEDKDLRTKHEENQEEKGSERKEDRKGDQGHMVSLEEDTKNKLEGERKDSVSSWIGTGGLNKMTDLWGSLTSNAQSLGEQTFQLASTTTNQLSQRRQQLLENEEEHMMGIAGRLNSVLLTMSQQVTQGLLDDNEELLNIFLVHDLYNLRYLDKVCYHRFSNVMDQVEGGIKVNVIDFNHKQTETERVDLNLFYGKIIDGDKLCHANMDSSIKQYLKAAKATEEANPDKKQQEDIESLHKSNVFISIQAVSQSAGHDAEMDKTDEEEDPTTAVETNNVNSFFFALILKDITNGINILTKTQAFPLKWAKWLCGEKVESLEEVNPSDWVRDWIKDGLALSLGVLAQEYVVKRMGL